MNELSQGSFRVAPGSTGVFLLVFKESPSTLLLGAWADRGREGDRRVY